MIRITVVIIALLIILSLLSFTPFIWPKKFSNLADMSFGVSEKQYITTRGESDLIKVISPKINETVSNKEILVKGYARGNWFFEGSFPVVVTDWDGLIIGEGYATADDEWMTTEYVPFSGKIKYFISEDIYSKRGTIIFQKDNPSGESRFDDSIEYSINFP